MTATTCRIFGVQERLGSKMIKRNLLINGAAGFLGGRFLEYCIQEGFNASAATSKRQVIPELKHGKVYDRLNLNDTTTCFDILSDTDVILDASGLDQWACKANQPEAIYVNIYRPALLLKLAAAAKVQRVVHLSSIQVFSEPENSVTPSARSKTPKTMYGISKLSGELALQCIAKENDIELVVLRLANIFGPQASFSDLQPNLFVNNLCKQLADHGRGNLKTPNAMRDFVPATYLMKILEKVCFNSELKFDLPITVCTGEAISCEQMAKTIIQMAQNRGLNWRVDAENIDREAAHPHRYSSSDCNRIVEYKKIYFQKEVQAIINASLQTK